MTEVIRTSNSFIKPIDISSKVTIVSIKQETKSSITRIKKIETSMASEGYTYAPPVTVLNNDGLIFDLSFSFSTQKAIFLLNDKEIGFFNAENKKETRFSINHNYLIEGMNAFSIQTIGLSDEVENKLFQVNYEVGTADDIEVGSQVIINAKQYTVLDCVLSGDSFEITLDKPLQKDVTATRLLEASKIHYTPLVDLTFEEASPSYKPMQFVKSIYKDGLVEEEYELSGLIGDQLHSQIALNREAASELPSLKKIERFMMART